MQVQVCQAKHEIKLLFTINTYLKQTKVWWFITLTIEARSVPGSNSRKSFFQPDENDAGARAAKAFMQSHFFQ